MAKQRKRLPARPQREAFDDSLLIRSAESLGRLIGALQREIDAARQLAGVRAGTRHNGATGARRSGAGRSDLEKRRKKARKTTATGAMAAKAAAKSARPR